MKREHFPEINIAKALTSILVVMGHAVTQTDTLNPVLTGIHSVIYSFHMPLFFFLSGFLSMKILSLNGFKEKLIYHKNRFLRLMVPYFIVGILYLPFKILLGSFARFPYNISDFWKILIGQNPDAALWFLYVLFVMSWLFSLFLNQKILPYVLLFSFLISGLTLIVTIQNGILHNLAFSSFFFLAGLYVRTIYSQLKKSIRIIPMLLLSIVLFTGFNYLILIYNYPLQHFTAITGTLGMVFFSICLLRWLPSISTRLQMLGDYAMDIYIFSEPFKVAVRMLFWSILGLNYILVTILCFLLALVFSVAFSKYFLRPFHIMRILFLGIHTPKKSSRN